MGWTDRLGKITGAVGGAMGDTVGFYKDMAGAVWAPKDFDSFAGEVGAIVKKRGTSFLTNTVGPEGIGGQVIGGTPEAIKAPLRKVMDVSEDIYSWGGKQVSTAITAASLSTADSSAIDGSWMPDAGGVSGETWMRGLERSTQVGLAVSLFRGDGEKLFNGETWKQASELSKDKSPGQNLVLMLMSEDRNDSAEVQKWEGASFYSNMTGAYDAFARMTLDPLIIGGKAISVARGTTMLREAGSLRPTLVPKVIAKQEHIDAAAKSTKWAKANAEMEGKSASYIQQRFFADERANGGAIATLLQDAKTADDRTELMRTFLGDKDAFMRLSTKSAAMRESLSEFYGKQDMLRRLEDGGFQVRNSADEIARHQEAIDELYPQYRDLKKQDRTFAALNKVPTATLAGKFRTEVTRSEFFQKSLLAAPVRVVTQNNPHRLVNLEDSGSHIHVKRMLEQSDLDQASRDIYLEKYMTAFSAARRQEALLEAEDAAIRSIGNTAGMTKESMEQVLASFNESRDTARTILNSRAYDGDNRSRVSFYDDEGAHHVEMPLMVSQNANVLPLADMRQMRKATTEMGQFMGRSQLAQIPNDVLTTYYKFWRPATLLRLGWPQRVLADEQMRIISFIGGINQLGNLAKVAASGGRAARTAAAAKVKGGASVKDALQTGAKSYDFGKQDLQIGKYAVPGSFATPIDDDNAVKALISARGTYQKLAGQTEDGLLKGLRNPQVEDDIQLPSGRMYTGEWGHIDPRDVDYGDAWEHAVNKQIGQDKLSRMFLEGKTTEEAQSWLTRTAEGREYLDEMASVRTPNPEIITQWLDNLNEHVRAYTADDPKLMALALEGKATRKDLFEQVPDEASRPTVHGQILLQAQRKGPVLNAVKTVTDGAWKALGQWPTDLLSRQPFFKTLYEAEAKRLVNLLDDGDFIDEAMIARITQQSRDFAATKTKSVLFDLAEESRFAEMLKFVSPFYMAWQEVLTRWMGIAIDQPQMLAKISNVWRSPERAGIVYDENGIRINGDGTGTDPLTGQQVKEFGKERYIRFMVPDYVTKVIPGIQEGAPVVLNKKSLNILMQGGPGVGPPVALSVNEIAKNRPEMADAVKWALPFGVQDRSDILLPTVVRRYQATQDEDDLTFVNTTNRIYQDKLVQWRQSLGGPNELEEPSYEDAIAQARVIQNVKLIGGLTLPVGINLQSPYQMHIDSWRRGRDAFGKWETAGGDKSGKPPPFGVDSEGEAITPDEWFYDTYGEELFLLTQSLSQSNDKVPATLQAMNAREKYQDLVEQFPEYGGFIVGDEGRGEFNRNVYKMQQGSKVSPGSDLNQRGPRTSEDKDDSLTRAGWLEYSRIMDIIDAERIDRGLPNLRVKAAADINATRQGAIAALAKKYPSWYTDYSQTDQSATSRRMAAFRKISSDSRFNDDPSMLGLREYIETRDAVQAELKRRKAGGGSATLTANTNADINEVWDNFTNDLIERNIAFGDTYHRWLENDQLTVGVTD